MQLFLIPHAAASVRLEPGRAELRVCGPRSWSASFDGTLAEDVAAFAASRVPSARLSGLAKTHPAVFALLSLRQETWQSLCSPMDAVRQDGFDTLFIEVTGACNERCLHCYADAGPKVQTSLERQTCEALLDDAAMLGFRRVQFTGGDPLLCEFLPELVAYAARLPFAAREIYTNGILLDDALLDRLAPHAPAFAFSYYSHVAATHDAITRRRGSHARTRAAVSRVVARGLPVRAAVIAMTENAADVEDAIKDLRSLGVPMVHVSGTVAVGRGKPHASSSRDGTGAGHRHGAAGGQGKLAVTSQGEVVPCIFNRRRVLGRIGPARLGDVVAALQTPQIRTRHLPIASLNPETQLACGSCRLTDDALSLLGCP